ncbi:hypothetical protein A2115_02230 [Candidatus Woesebacteria bacterium GWA1_41_8]|jgi:hypothetical protein|uniref:Uncharacterized protein n=1 Tax=Candidatus Woesebacteria bacterium GWA1_41_8 TaxID=1802471 RepID=A0A1F7WJS3_9BACT|nr:MAG: hypothetical protein A2115_02230 [Candidatus Woesebacteria bacterium GWA1_41_8]
MDGIQKLLAIVVVSLTTLLVIVGIQVILIIADLRRAIKRLNSILEDSIMGGGLIRPDKLTGVLELFGRGKRVKERGSMSTGNFSSDAKDNS